MTSKLPRPKLKTYFRQCKRCNRFYHSTARRSIVCDKCKIKPSEVVRLRNQEKSDSRPISAPKNTLTQLKGGKSTNEINQR